MILKGKSVYHGFEERPGAPGVKQEESLVAGAKDRRRTRYPGWERVSGSLMIRGS